MSNNDFKDDLESGVKYLTDKFRHRKGLSIGNKKIDDIVIKLPKAKKKIWFPLNNDVFATIEDTINILYEKRELKPYIVKKNKNIEKDMYTVIIHLPPGITYREFLKQIEYFKDAVGGVVEMKRQKNSVVMNIRPEDFLNLYPYEWHWQKYNKMILPIPLGYSVGGLVVVDLVKFPHILAGGMTNYGKSSILHVIIMALLQARRNNCFMIIIDRKRVDFGYLREAGCLVVNDPPDIQKVLVKLLKEYEHRTKILEREGVRKIQNSRSGLPYIVVVIDEVAQIKDKVSQELITELVALTRAVGIHFIIATQRPSHSIFAKQGAFTDARAELGGRICFYVADQKNSEIVLGEGFTQGSLLPPTPGRCIYRYGHNLLELQSLFLPVDNDEKTSETKYSAREMVKQINTIPKWEQKQWPMWGGKTHEQEPPKRLPPGQKGFTKFGEIAGS